MAIARKVLSKNYYPEIDIIRGIAIIAMILFHAAFMLSYFFNLFSYENLFFWQGTPQFISGVFLTLSGLSLYIAAQRGKYTNFIILLKRSVFIFGIGMTLTLITSLTDLGGVVYFGILHCVGLGTLLSFYLMKLPKYVDLLVGILTIGIGMYGTFIIPAYWSSALMWLYPTYCPELSNFLDYYPLMPSIGFMLVGIFLGKMFYPAGEAKHRYISTINAWWEPLRLLGRHSLLIYFIHLPIIFPILYLVCSFFKMNR